MDISKLTIGELEQLITDIKTQLGEKMKPDVTFPPGSVPTKVAARVFGKDPCWVHAGIIAGWLPIGTATRNGHVILDVQDIDSRKGKINYYISPKLLYEQTGFIWKGEKE